MPTLNTTDQADSAPAEFNPWEYIGKLSRAEIIPLLPASLADLPDHIPLSDVIQLIHDLGGFTITFPSPDKLREDHLLSLSIGMESSLILCRVCEGIRVSFPVANNLIRVARYKFINDLRHLHNWEIWRIARHLKVCERTVYKALASE